MRKWLPEIEWQSPTEMLNGKGIRKYERSATNEAVSR